VAQTDIKAALAKLDSMNDNHWTEDSLPRLEAVRFLAGDQSLTREQVNAASPGFSRVTALQGVQGAATQAAAATPAPAVTPVLNAPASGLPKVEEAAPVKVLPTDEEIESARQELEKAKLRVADATKLKADAEKEFEAANKVADAALLRYEELVPKESEAQAFRSYLDTQASLLQKRADRIKQMEGINLSDILPKKSPIDAAMTRRTGFGGKRPTR
jgi:hypothetical protein